MEPGTERSAGRKKGSFKGKFLIGHIIAHNTMTIVLSLSSATHKIVPWKGALKEVH